MNKVRIANNLTSHLLGQSDGIIFTMVSEEDTNLLRKLCEKYGKQIEVHTNWYEESAKEDSEKTTKKSKDISRVKKMWVNKGKELKKINPDELSTYMQNGWKAGRKPA